MSSKPTASWIPVKSISYNVCAERSANVRMCRCSHAPARDDHCIFFVIRVYLVICMVCWFSANDGHGYVFFFCFIFVAISSSNSLYCLVRAMEINGLIQRTKASVVCCILKWHSLGIDHEFKFALRYHHCVCVCVCVFMYICFLSSFVRLIIIEVLNESFCLSIDQLWITMR